MSAKLGRNDPCPCGSGKKYKRCHLEADQAQARRDAFNPDSPHPFQSSLELAQLLRKLPADLQASMAPVLDYYANQSQINSACAKLEDYRQDFLALHKNLEAYTARAQALFAEDKFIPLRFSAAELHSAFEAVGYPTRYSPEDKRTLENVRQAILFLANKDRRATLSISLISLIPHYLEANRPMDAWIIQHCAFLTGQATDEPNEFLFEMFSIGFEAWADERAQLRQSLLDKVGWNINDFQDKTPEELRDWINAERADPSKAALMEAVLNASPETKSAMDADFQRMEEDAVQLLERDDAQSLFLSTDELEPWLPGLFERLQVLAQEPADDSDPDLQSAELSVASYIGEINQAIFTEDRIRQLISELQGFATRLRSTGCQPQALSATATALYLEREQYPGQNPFLYSLCVASIRHHAKTASKQTSQSPAIVQ